jgi:hypothetical protein
MYPGGKWAVMKREAKIGLGLAVVLGLLITLVYYFVAPAVLPSEIAPTGLGGPPRSEEIVEAFREEGLEVARSESVDEEEDWQDNLVPKTYKEGTRFIIRPGRTENDEMGGRVFTYDSEEDLEVMRNYYETVSSSGMFYTHVYTDGLVLMQINGQIPKAQADRYGEVLEEEV